MTPNVRIYGSEQGARDADAALDANGFRERTLLLPSEVAGREAEAVEEAIAAGMLPDRNVRLATRSLLAGRPVLAVRAPFGSGETALELMESGGDTVDNELLTNYSVSSPSPLSDALGIPTLVPFSSSTSLVSSSWSLSRTFGMGILGGKAAPLSSLFKIPLLTKRKRDRRSSFGIPLISRNAAPLSSLFGMGTLSKRRKEPRTSSFGFPLLMRNPAPFSSLIGWKTLSGQDHDRT
ncbi:MAG: hypothetical protein AAFW98_01715 [Pseudomonadota bacterium]